MLQKHHSPGQELPYRLDRIALLSLARQNVGHCVSLYLPVHLAGMEVSELSDPVLFRECIREAASQLRQIGVRVAVVQKILAPAEDLIKEDAFWRGQQQGLVFFAAEDFCRYIRLPEAPLRQLVINDHFLLAPLIPFLADNEHFLC
jgi:hypothetical protein